MRLTLTRSAAIAPLLAVTLLLAACSGGDSADPTPTASEATGKDGSGKDGSGKDEPTTDATDDTGDDVQAGSDGAACLEGEWSADVADQVAAFKDAMAATGVDATIDLSGEVVTSFSGGTTTTTYNNQVMDISIAMEGQSIQTVTTLNGTVTGTYTATDTDVSMTTTDASGLDIAMDTYMAGEKVDTGAIGGIEYADTMRQSMETTSSAAYTCSGDTLTITMPNAELGAAVATVMHRR